MLGAFEAGMEKVKGLDGFRTAVEVQTRFRDTDAMGHVNNAVYLSYMELARMEYVRRVFGVTDYRSVDFILARSEIDYRSPAYAGEALTVGIRVSKIGGASFAMDYRIVEGGTGRLVAEARTVQVAFDYRGGKVKRVPSEFRRKVEKYDGLS